MGKTSSLKITDLKDFGKLTSGSKVSSASSSRTSSIVKENSLDDPFDHDNIGYVNGSGNNSSNNAAPAILCDRLPQPTEFGDGNPFLMFICIACLLQHRNAIMNGRFDYQEIAMYFDKMVRKHDVNKTLGLARKLFAEYLNDDWAVANPSENGKASC